MGPAISIAKPASAAIRVKMPRVVRIAFRLLQF
jgi:hypothetical protein